MFFIPYLIGAAKVQLFPRILPKNRFVSLVYQKSTIFAVVLNADFVSPTYRNTKRYARLANGNVRSFYKMQE